MSIQRTFAVGDHARLDVDVRSGRVAVETGRVGEVELRVAGRVEEDNLEIEQVGDMVRVRQLHHLVVRGGSIRVYATVPPGTDVEVTGASADIFLAGRLGDVELRTASGDISVQSVGRLEVKTASGDIRGEEAGGDLVFSSASGDVFVGTVAGRVAGTLASGDFRLGRAGGEVRVHTASGDVRIDRCEGSEVSVKTVSGDVTLGIAAGTRVDADITTMSGRIRLPEKVEEGLREGSTPTSPAPRRLALQVRSLSGDVEIVRA